MFYEKLINNKLIERGTNEYLNEGELYHNTKKEYQIYSQMAKENPSEELEALLEVYEEVLDNKIKTTSNTGGGHTQNVRFGSYSLETNIRTTLYDRIDKETKKALVGNTTESLNSINNRLFFGRVKAYELTKKLQIEIYKQLMANKMYGTVKTNNIDFHWFLNGEINLHDPNEAIILADLPEDVKKSIASEVATSKFSQGAFMINCKNGGNYGRK